MLSLVLVSFLTFVELNCENLFDCQHDSLKEDYAFLPDGEYHWTPNKYWKKLNHISQAILSCSSEEANGMLPDIIALAEVENDTVMRDLTKRSLLRNARYNYVMTSSHDVRGIDVALMYSPFVFQPLYTASLVVDMPKGTHPTRDILYVKGRTKDIESLHVFVVHAPSRVSGELPTQNYRMLVVTALTNVVDSIRYADSTACIVAMGDFNDYANDRSLRYLSQHGLTNISASAVGKNNEAKGTYRYHGRWGSLDHLLVNDRLLEKLVTCYINDASFLTEEDKRYGGRKPLRNYVGRSWNNGYSDHLPLVAIFAF